METKIFRLIILSCLFSITTFAQEFKYEDYGSERLIMKPIDMPNLDGYNKDYKVGDGVCYRLENKYFFDTYASIAKQILSKEQIEVIRTNGKRSLRIDMHFSAEGKPIFAYLIIKKNVFETLTADTLRKLYNACMNYNYDPNKMFRYTTDGFWESIDRNKYIFVFHSFFVTSKE